MTFDRVSRVGWALVSFCLGYAAACIHIIITDARKGL